MENKDLILTQEEKNEIVNFNSVELTLGDIYNRHCVHVDNYGNGHVANKREWAEFKYLIQAYELDPNVNEITMIPFYNKKLKKYSFQVIVGVNGFTKKANEQGLSWEYFDNFNGRELIATTIKIYFPINSNRHPISETVYMDEFNPNLLRESDDQRENLIWATKPKTMLHKVALVTGLRRAGILAGVYIKEELEAGIPFDSASDKPNDNVVRPTTPVNKKPDNISNNEDEKLYKEALFLCKEIAIFRGDKAVKKLIQDKYNKRLKDLKGDQLKDLHSLLESELNVLEISIIEKIKNILGENEEKVVSEYTQGSKKRIEDLTNEQKHFLSQHIANSETG